MHYNFSLILTVGKSNIKMYKDEKYERLKLTFIITNYSIIIALVALNRNHMKTLLFNGLNLIETMVYVDTVRKKKSRLES